MQNNPQITQRNVDGLGDEESHANIGAAMTVYCELGCGLLEVVNQDALEKEFQHLNALYKRKVKRPAFDRGEQLNNYYQVDLICFDSVISELNVLQKLSGTEETQVINFLKASNVHRSRLSNFKSNSLQHKRLVLNLRESAQSAGQKL